MKPPVAKRCPIICLERCVLGINRLAWWHESGVWFVEYLWKTFETWQPHIFNFPSASPTFPICTLHRDCLHSNLMQHCWYGQRVPDVCRRQFLQKCLLSRNLSIVFPSETEVSSFEKTSRAEGIALNDWCLKLQWKVDQGETIYIWRWIFQQCGGCEDMVNIFQMGATLSDGIYPIICTHW